MTEPRVRSPPPPFDSLRSLMAGLPRPARSLRWYADYRVVGESNVLSKRSASKGCACADGSYYVGHMLSVVLCERKELIDGVDALEHLGILDHDRAHHDHVRNPSRWPRILALVQRGIIANGLGIEDRNVGVVGFNYGKGNMPFVSGEVIVREDGPGLRCVPPGVFAMPKREWTVGYTGTGAAVFTTG